jgi:curli biogenesis system outer membrane secretion channel CsgG
MHRIYAFLIVAATAALPAYPQAKPRVAVMDFDYGTVQSYVSSIFGTNADVGRGLSDLIVTKLVQDGKFSVIERKMLDKVLAEQNFSNSDRADSNSAAKIGKILGVDAIIVGSITQFGRDDKKTGLGGFGHSLDKYGMGGVGVSKAKAVVGLTARVVSTDTAEILAVASGKGESTRSGTNLLGGGGSGWSGGGGHIDMSSSNYANTILGEATTQAANDLVAQLEANSGRVTAKAITIDALVADVSPEGIIINAGSKAGLKVGDQLSVKRTGREIRDPSSGKVIRKVEESLGDITITEVDELSAVGKFTGAGKPKVGDAVHSVSK